MKFSLRLSFVLSLLLGFVACSDGDKTAGGSEDTNGVAIIDKTVSGVSQKGPFVKGSSVKLYELNGKSLRQTGKSFTGKITSDKGEFKIPSVNLASQYALFEATGYYRDEVSGQKSSGTITLNALTDLKDRKNVNVNLLTHLEYERVLKLVEDGSSVFEAKEQAETEIFEAFGIEGDFEKSEDLSIFNDGEGDAALLAFSVLMLSNLSEAELTERLTNFALDVAEDGQWDDSTEIVKIADWARNQTLFEGLFYIRQNVLDWNMGEVADFEKYVKRFWWNVYGLGICNKERNGEVLKNQNEMSAYADEYYICKAGEWLVATDIEKDTYGWEKGKDGDVKVGAVNANNCYVFEGTAWRTGEVTDCSLNLRGCTALRQGLVGQGGDQVWYTCDAMSWRKSTIIEVDTAQWGVGENGEVRAGQINKSIYYTYDALKKSWRRSSNLEKDVYDYKNNKPWAAGADGDSKAGSVNANNCYVFEGTAWRIGEATDCSLKLRGCTALRQDTVGQGSDKVWYTCDEKNWRKATNIEMDTALWGAGENGEVRTGQINKSIYYIYETKTKSWRKATNPEKDVYDYGNNKPWSAGVDGEIKKGAITNAVYVYDATAWRAADDIESVLGGCVASIKDSVGKAGSTYYICKPRKWTEATVLQYDTYRWNDTIDGAWKKGNVNKTNVYVFDQKEGAWRTSTTVFDYTLGFDGCTVNRNKERVNDYDEENEVNHYYICYNKKWYDGYKWNWELPKDVYFNPDIDYGTLVDDRDGQVYKTVKIGDQVWMAENLNYADSVATPSLKGKSWCYDNVAAHCEVTGRYYTWAAVIDSVQIYKDYNEKCGDGRTCDRFTSSALAETLIQGICPEGWHLPSADEWRLLYKNASENPFAMQAKGFVKWPNATDEYGFSALPVGDYNGGNSYVGSDARFWSATEFSSSNAHDWILDASGAGLGYNFKSDGYSVRCLQD